MMTRDDAFARSGQRCAANQDRQAGPATTAPFRAASEGSHWFGLALLLAGLFLLTILLMTAAIILIADHKHVSFGTNQLSTASVATVGTQMLSGQSDRRLPGRVNLQRSVMPVIPRTLPLVAAQVEMAHHLVAPMIEEPVRSDVAEP
jgi:hypothetical protein